MGHYSNYYDAEREESARINNKKALDEFSKKIEMVNKMPTENIVIVNYFIHWLSEIKTGIVAIRHLLKLF